MHSDEKLVEMFQTGDAGAFDTLFERYKERIYLFLYRMVGRREDALDLTQDTFLSAYLSLDRWRPRAKFSTWLFTIAVNKARSFLKQSKQRLWERPVEVQKDLMDTIREIQIESQHKNPVEQYGADRFVYLFKKGIGLLPDQQRKVFVLRHSTGLKLAEIAAAMGLKEGTVKAHLFKAVSNLMRFFESEGVSLKDMAGGRSDELDS